MTNIEALFSKTTDELDNIIMVRCECSSCPAKDFCDTHSIDASCIETFKEWGLKKIK